MKKEFASYLKRKILEISLSRGEIVTQSEFAQMMDIPQASMSQYLNGTRLPKDENAHKMAELLGVEVYQRLGMPTPMPDDPALTDLIAAYQALPGDRKQTYLDLMVTEARKYKSE